MPDAVSERRTAVIVFAQVLGALPGDALFGELRSRVERHGGIVDKFIGDVVMAVFGAPVARGDDTARAMRAAIAMRAAARAAGCDLRAGINRGEVFWSSVAGERATAMGDPVNVAQRLQSAASPGAVVASRAAWDAAGDSFEGRSLGALTLKGRTETVEAWEVESLPPGATRRGMPGMRETPFLGREQSLAGLMARFREGTGGLVVVSGAAGTGKSRLLAELRRLARLAAARAWVATGRAQETAAIPRAAFGEIVRDATGVDGAADPEGLAASLVRDLEGRPASGLQRRTWADLIMLSLGFAVPGAGAREMDPLQVRGETSDAWRNWILARSGGGPALLCLEDLQWADPFTHELLGDVVAGLRGLPVLFVGALRPGTEPSVAAHRVELDDLPADASRAIASAVLGAPLDDSLAAFLAGRAGGNPLFVEELCLFLRDRGLVAGTPRTLTGDPGGIPGGLQDLLVAQADALAASSKASMKAASVVGTTFWTGLVGRILGLDGPADVHEARSRAMVAPRESSLLPGDSEFAFRHALIREALYSLLPRRDRTRFHGQIAQDLAGPGLPARMDLLSLAARHAESAGEPARAAELWMRVYEATLSESTIEQGLRAASEAARLGYGARAVVAESEALLRLGRAPEALQKLEAIGAGEDPDLTARVASAKSNALLELGRVREGLAAAESARAIAVTAAERFRAVRSEARALEILGRRDEAFALVTRSRDEVERGALPPGPARDLVLSGLCNLEAIIAWWRGDMQRGFEVNERAYELACSAGSRELTAGALHNRAIHMRVAGRHSEAIAAAEKALALRREIGDHSGIALSLNSVSACLFTVGRFAEAARFARESAAAARDARTPETLARALLNLSITLAKAGRLDDAVAAAGEAVEVRRRMGILRPLVFALTSAAYVFLQAREVAKAREALEEADPASRTEAPEYRAEVLCHLSEVEDREGNPGRAREHAEESLKEAEKRPGGGMVPFAFERLSALRRRRGEAAAAIALAERAVGLRRGTPNEALALTALARGRLAAGDAAGAATAACEAATGAARLGARLDEMEARRAWAAALRELGRPEEASTEASAALEIARSTGAARLAAEVEAGSE